MKLWWRYGNRLQYLPLIFVGFEMTLPMALPSLATMREVIVQSRPPETTTEVYSMCNTRCYTRGHMWRLENATLAHLISICAASSSFRMKASSYEILASS